MIITESEPARRGSQQGGSSSRGQADIQHDYPPSFM
jgi:hypothetical protein